MSLGAKKLNTALLRILYKVLYWENIQNSVCGKLRSVRNYTWTVTNNEGIQFLPNIENNDDCVTINNDACYTVLNIIFIFIGSN